MLADSGQNLTAAVTLSSDEENSYVSKDTIVTASSSDGKSADNLMIASIDNREADGTIVLNIPLPQNKFSLTAAFGGTQFFRRNTIAVFRVRR